MTEQPTSAARAAASRLNGARSRGPKTPAGKARAAMNALKHGLCARRYVVLPQEDPSAFAALEGALLAELAPVGALQMVLASRIARAAWRLERAERFEAELFAFRGYEDADLGLTLVRDGNGTRSVETIMRYRTSALLELTRALRTLQGLQAAAAAAARAATTTRAPARPAVVGQTPRLRPARPNEPERHVPTRAALTPAPPEGGRHDMPPSWQQNEPEPARPAPALHEPAALWQPNEPEPARPAAALHELAALWQRNEPEPARPAPALHEAAALWQPNEPERGAGAPACAGPTGA